MAAWDPTVPIADQVVANTLARVDEDERFTPRQRKALRALAAAPLGLTNADDIVRALLDDATVDESKPAITDTPRGEPSR